ncbi:hypothetical protein RJ641_015353 [Dillenia turbinata]|uniref:Uncharacterized protein n=1 Tax=Dillenia turbinata TaxID=194707 RepID=A0AAN8URW0_9MAGN
MSDAVKDLLLDPSILDGFHFSSKYIWFLTVQALINQSDGPDHQNQSPSKFHRKLKLESSAEVSRISDPPVELKSTSSGEDESAVAEAPKVEIRRLEKHRSDKSVAGGGVIIGGLATAILAAVFCYIRVTRPRKNDSS